MLSCILGDSVEDRKGKGSKEDEPRPRMVSQIGEYLVTQRRSEPNYIVLG